MDIKLPYNIGTIVFKVENGKPQYDRVHHYIVGNKCEVVLELCYNTSPRLSVPISIEKLEREWSILDINE